MENIASAYLFPPIGFGERLEELRKYVKDSLWKLGYGHDQHLAALSGDIYFEHRAKDDYPFLFKILDFYKSALDWWERLYFVNEILEKGEHYPFWHWDMSTRAYYGSEKRALKKIMEGLLNEEAPF